MTLESMESKKMITQKKKKFKKSGLAKPDSSMTDLSVASESNNMEISQAVKKSRKPKKRKQNEALEVTTPTLIEAKDANFQVIGDGKLFKKAHVVRVLPQWLAKPIIISADLSLKNCPVEDILHLDQSLKTQLKTNKIDFLFPVQSQVIPYILNPPLFSLCRRPSDLCISAPTGSGKTLAYVLPIIQTIKDCVVQRIQALVVLPVQELALQVFEVFQEYVKNTSLQVGLATGHRPLGIEQKLLLKTIAYNDYQPLIDILIATPGRLLDHILHTPGFSLKHLRFLVIDEADRLMENSEVEWLKAVEEQVYGPHAKSKSCICQDSYSFGRAKPGPIAPCGMNCILQPFQKLLYSATLSHNPEKLQRLSLFNPKLFTSDSAPKAYQTKPQKDFIGRYTTPDNLLEFISICENDTKPLLVWYWLTQEKYEKVLCFVDSTEKAHRLYILLKKMGGIAVKEFSSRCNQSSRKNAVKHFNKGTVNVLVCTDAIARGMDFKTVNYVICYDQPRIAQTYVHRIGRTARAGKKGTAISMVSSSGANKFQDLLQRTLGKGKLPEIVVEKEKLDAFTSQYKEALQQVSEFVEAEEAFRKSIQNPHVKKRAFSRKDNAASKLTVNDFTKKIKKSKLNE